VGKVTAMINRIKSIIQESKMSNGEFAAHIGINKASLSHVLSGRNKPSLDFVMKVLEAFPGISSDWLLFGREPNVIHVDNLKQEKPNLEVNKSDDMAQKINQKNIQNMEGIEQIIIVYSNNHFRILKNN
jgi:transcriptional regulator with XRE-family HTH domain